MTNMAPVAAADRLEVLDALRGVALLGILAANLLVFSGVMYLDENVRDAMPLAKLDAAVRWLQMIFIEGKFYGLFSLLFGMGAAMQLGAGADGRTRLFRRRMLVLAVIGLLHSVVWNGDILLFYAVLGLLLPSCIRLSDRRLLQVGFGLFAVAAIWQYLVFGGVTLLGLPSGWPFSLGWKYLEPHYPVWDAAQARGDMLLVFRYNLTGIWADRWPGLLATGRPFKVFGFFLLGMWAVRANIPAAIGAHRALLQRVARWGVAVGVPAGVLFAAGRFLGMEGLLGMLHPMVESLAILSLSLGYAACFALAWHHWRPGALQLFQPLGRMALTTYLGQTLICVVGLTGMGLGWYMEIGATVATALAVPVILLQMAFAHWWLRRFQFGPVEWLWRSLTYRARQPMRRG